MAQNILGFQVAMYNLMTMEFLKYYYSYSNTIYYLLQNKYSFFFRNSDLHLDFILKSASVAELNDHYFKGFVFVDIVTLDYVLAIAEHHEL